MNTQNVTDESVLTDDLTANPTLDEQGTNTEEGREEPEVEVGSDLEEMQTEEPMMETLTEKVKKVTKRVKRVLSRKSTASKKKTSVSKKKAGNPSATA